jgi:hypothetical protein
MMPAAVTSENEAENSQHSSAGDHRPRPLTARIRRVALNHIVDASNVRVMNSQKKVWRIAPSPLALPAHSQGGHTAITTVLGRGRQDDPGCPGPGHHQASAPSIHRA